MREEYGGRERMSSRLLHQENMDPQPFFLPFPTSVLIKLLNALPRGKLSNYYLKDIFIASPYLFSVQNKPRFLRSRLKCM